MHWGHCLIVDILHILIHRWATGLKLSLTAKLLLFCNLVRVLLNTIIQNSINSLTFLIDSLEQLLSMSLHILVDHFGNTRINQVLELSL